MFRVVYVSSARSDFTQDELDALLAKSRKSNHASGVTGMLLYHDGNFIQALEGERAAVEAILDRIERDPRHGQLLVLIQEEVEERAFGEWSMGYVRREDLPDDQRDGYSRFLQEAAERGMAPSRAHRLLETFRRNIR